MEKRNCYLYRYIRLDTNQPFYIGIGAKRDRNNYSIKNEYERAFVKKDRSNYWTNIVNKSEYLVEILLEDLTAEEAKSKEIEFISLYGRLDIKSGILVNMTNGGDGQHGAIVSAKTRLINSKRLKGKKQPIELISKRTESTRITKSCPIWRKKNSILMKKVGESKKIKCICSNGMIFDGFSDAVDWLKDNGYPKAQDSKLIQCCKGKSNTAYSFKWEYLDYNIIK